MMGDSNSVKVSRKKWCFVPGCTNTSINKPGKVFISVPSNLQRKKLWFIAARRELKDVSIKTHFYCCEDHFKLEEDMENYLEYKLSKVNIRMKPEVLPHIFTCRTDKNIDDSRQSSERRAKKRKSSQGNENVIKVNKFKTDFCCQANLIHYRSKGIQVSCRKDSTKK